MINDRSIDQNNIENYIEGIDDVRQCWLNILFTIPGTFPMLPDFGCDLFKYIDKTITNSFGKIRNVIIAALEKFEPRAKINKVTRTINNEQILINIFGTYTSTGESIISQIDLSTSFSIYKDADGNWNKDGVSLYYATLLNINTQLFFKQVIQ